MDSSNEIFVDVDKCDLLQELNKFILTLKHSNKINFKKVIESGKRSMESLEKVTEMVEDINERTIRIQHTSSGSLIDIRSKSNENAAIGSRNSNTQATRPNFDSNNDEISKSSKYPPTNSNQNRDVDLNPREPSSASYESNGDGDFNRSKKPIEASANANYESSDRREFNRNKISPTTSSSNELWKESENVGFSRRDSTIDNTRASHDSNSDDGFNQRKNPTDASADLNYGSSEKKVTNRNGNSLKTSNEMWKESENPREPAIGNTGESSEGREFNGNVGKNFMDPAAVRTGTSYESNDSDVFNRNAKQFEASMSADYASRETEGYDRNKTPFKTSNDVLKAIGHVDPNRSDATEKTYESNDFNGMSFEDSTESRDGKARNRNSPSTFNKAFDINENVSPNGYATGTSTRTNYEMNESNTGDSYRPVAFNYDSSEIANNDGSGKVSSTIVIPKRASNENETTGGGRKKVVMSTTSNNQFNENNGRYVDESKKLSSSNYEMNEMLGQNTRNGLETAANNELIGQNNLSRNENASTTTNTKVTRTTTTKTFINIPGKNRTF